MAGGFYRPTIIRRVTPTLDAGTDYADGDAIAGLMNLDGMGRSGIMTRLYMKTITDITVQTFVYLFDSNPSASTFTDNGAISIAAGDRTRIIKTWAIAAADWVDPHGGSGIYSVDLDDIRVPYELPSGQRLYWAWESDGAINFGTAADVEVIWHAEANG